MVNEKIKLASNNSFITTYIPSTFESFNGEKKWPLVIICPGGGYHHLSDREAEPVALKLNSLGFAAVVLTYTVAPLKGGEPLDDLVAAIKTVRINAENWKVDPKKIIVGGFSAGGHLSATLGCFWKKYGEETRPDYMMLCYPVITTDEKYSHKGSADNIIGTEGKFKKEDFSLENFVTEDFPPTFMWHTNQDQSVPAENSLFFAAALRRAGVDMEYHLFSNGSHGLSLATMESSKSDGSNTEMECAIWPELFQNWAITKGIL